jgi:hypothetical protein
MGVGGGGVWCFLNLGLSPDCQMEKGWWEGYRDQTNWDWGEGMGVSDY